MYLQSLQIQKYKCIDNTGEFKLDPVTCLVGKNEAGKSAILQALYKLNPVYEEDSDFNDVIEYPRRHWSDYSMGPRETDPDNVITSIWMLDPDDTRVIDGVLGVEGIVGDEVKVCKGYANRRIWYPTIHEDRLVKYLLANSGLHAEELEKLGGVESVEAIFAAIEGLEERSERHELFVGDLTKKN